MITRLLHTYFAGNGFFSHIYMSNGYASAWFCNNAWCIEHSNVDSDIVYNSTKMVFIVATYSGGLYSVQTNIIPGFKTAIIRLSVTLARVITITQLHAYNNRLSAPPGLFCFRSWHIPSSSSGPGSDSKRICMYVPTCFPHGRGSMLIPLLTTTYVHTYIHTPHPCIDVFLRRHYVPRTRSRQTLEWRNR